MKWTANGKYRSKKRKERREARKKHQTQYDSAISELLRNSWQKWYAWRPVLVPEATYNALVVPAHYVWLEPVDWRVDPQAPILWSYRANKVEDYGTYDYRHRDAYEDTYCNYTITLREYLEKFHPYLLVDAKHF
jgi:hypothetical protein